MLAANCIKAIPMALGLFGADLSTWDGTLSTPCCDALTSPMCGTICSSLRNFRPCLHLNSEEKGSDKPLTHERQNLEYHTPKKRRRTCSLYICVANGTQVSPFRENLFMHIWCLSSCTGSPKPQPPCESSSLRSCLTSSSMFVGSLNGYPLLRAGTWSVPELGDVWWYKLYFVFELSNWYSTTLTTQHYSYQWSLKYAIRLKPLNHKLSLPGYHVPSDPKFIARQHEALKSVLSRQQPDEVVENLSPRSVEFRAS